MKWTMLLPLFAAGCGATPVDVLSTIGGVGVASVAIIHRTPFDAAWSMATGQDCSAVRLDRNESYCRLEERPPEQPVFCTRSLARVDCWQDPEAVLGHPRTTGDGVSDGVADGRWTLTPEQEADRTRRWPF